MPYERTDEERDEEVRLIDEDMGWPFWPLLPVKRHTTEHGLEVGVIQSVAKSTVVHTNLWAFDPDASKTEYASIREMVEAGWVGD